MSGDENPPKDRLRRRLKRPAFPPEPPYPEPRRTPSSPPGANWTERYEAAVEAENRFLDKAPDGNWHMFRAILPLAIVGVVLVAWLISVLSG
jgi:hypothetical protein